MKNEKKIALLQRLIEQSGQIAVRDSSDPIFTTWRNTVERVLARIYGADSTELAHFNQLRFFYQGIIMYLGEDYSREHREQFERDFKVAIESLKGFKAEFEDFPDLDEVESESLAISRLFISHSSKDLEYVEILVDLLESLGLSGDRIFCTSLEGYGIGLGEDFLDTIRDELRADTLVVFLLSKNFFDSPVCLCEMGATWVQTKEHIPILIPPFGFADVKGVIPTTQGFKINEPMKLNLLKEKIESTFGFKSNLTTSSWERKRDKAVTQLNEAIQKTGGVLS